jgi:hypothetical protein
LARSSPTDRDERCTCSNGATLFIDGYVHFHNAGFYDAVRSSVLSQGTLFRLQAGLAVVVGLMLLVRPRRLWWAVALLVAGSAFGAVELYRYVDVGALGPLPNMFEPTWALPGKLASAWAEGAGTAVSALGLVLSILADRSNRRNADQAPRRTATDNPRRTDPAKAWQRSLQAGGIAAPLNEMATDWRAHPVGRLVAAATIKHRPEAGSSAGS